MLLRDSEEIKYCLSVQAGQKLQVGRKGLQQEIASNLKVAQPQFIYLPPPNSEAHHIFFIFELYFCLNEGIDTDDWHWYFLAWWLGGCYQNCKVILFLSYFFIHSNSKINKKKPSAVFSLLNAGWKKKCPFSTLEMTTNTSIFPIFIWKFLTEHNSLMFSDKHSLKNRHLCSHLKEASNFKIHCALKDIKLCREAATPHHHSTFNLPCDNRTAFSSPSPEEILLKPLFSHQLFCHYFS